MGRAGVGVTAAVALVSVLGCGPVIAFCDEADGCGEVGQGSTGGTPETSSAVDGREPMSTTGTTGTTSTGTGDGLPRNTDGMPTDDTTTHSDPEPGPPIVPGDPTPCLLGGNVMILDGDEGDWIHSGSLVMTDFAWSETIAGEPVDSFRLQLEDAEEALSQWWNVWFRSIQLRTPLVVGTYPDAMRAPFEDPGHPGLSIYGNGNGCNRVAGDFEIHELVFDGEILVSLTATWAHYCEEGTSELRGCLHWER
jgi:hypothetical protein